ncbi:hypothetical protein DFH11DRAFT_1725338 [Phellopilus nigrolimitatus]|nr:hypothetical protein DFH11DRAFT_1725338 [Phellopilus nigrolimitatus]
MSTTPALPALDNTLGALYIGVVICMGLWGAGTVQVYYYFNMYPKDNWWMKFLVIVVWALDTIHQALITHSSYVYLITQYANVLYLSHLEPTLEYMVLVSSFLVYRIWKLSSGNVLLVSAIMIAVIAEFAAVLAFFGRGVQYETFEDVLAIWWLSVTVDSLVAASDLAVAAALIFYLNRVRTGFQRSESTINRLIFFSINTGLVTSMSAVLSVIFLCVYQNTLIYIAFYINVSDIRTHLILNLVHEVYANSLFATLNSRKSVRNNLAGETTTEGSQSIPLSALRSFRSGAKTRFTGTTDSEMGGLDRLAIKVNTVTMDDSTGAKNQFANNGKLEDRMYEAKRNLSDAQV